MNHAKKKHKIEYVYPASRPLLHVIFKQTSYVNTCNRMEIFLEVNQRLEFIHVNNSK